MIIYQNILDSHHLRQHLMPFLKTFSTEQAISKKSNVNIRRLGPQHAVILFESNVSSSTQKHHSIGFPGQLKHDEVLFSYLDSTAESRHEILSVYSIFGWVICSVSDPALILGGFEFCFYLMNGLDLLASSGWGPDSTIIFKVSHPVTCAGLFIKLFVRTKGNRYVDQRHWGAVRHF